MGQQKYNLDYYFDLWLIFVKAYQIAYKQLTSNQEVNFCKG